MGMPGVGQAEQRDNEVARPGMPELLQAVVGRDRGPHAGAKLPRHPGRRLLPEVSEEI